MRIPVIATSSDESRKSWEVTAKVDDEDVMLIIRTTDIPVAFDEATRIFEECKFNAAITSIRLIPDELTHE